MLGWRLGGHNAHSADAVVEMEALAPVICASVLGKRGKPHSFQRLTRPGFKPFFGVQASCHQYEYVGPYLKVTAEDQRESRPDPSPMLILVLFCWDRRLSEQFCPRLAGPGEPFCWAQGWSTFQHMVCQADWPMAKDAAWAACKPPCPPKTWLSPEMGGWLAWGKRREGSGDPKSMKRSGRLPNPPHLLCRCFGLLHMWQRRTARSMNKAGVGVHQLHYRLTIDEKAYQRAWPPLEQKKKDADERRAKP